MPIAQKSRPIKVKTPLGDDVLVLSAMSGTEELGRLFKYDLDLLSEDNNIKLEDILGQNLTVSLALQDGSERYFNGIVNRFCQVGQTGGLAHYQATLCPWFWLLTRRSDCRIFQNKTVPDIIKEVFQDNGFPDYEISLSNDYREWENCVQYRETDFNFISRLMEQEGIYYFFIHEDGKHILRLADLITAHEAITNPDIPYYSRSDKTILGVDFINDWRISRDLQPGAFMYRDFDFKKPKANMDAKLINPFEHDYSEYEMYDCPGEYTTADEGNNYVATRLEELQVNYEQLQGECNVRTLYSGGLFNLFNYPREDQNREYLIISTSYQIQSGEFAGGTGGGQDDIYSCSFNAISSDTPYRTKRTTPKPVVQGPQTAIVVGPSGEEIWTDKYGRVKVQFHWDRYGETNENSSCWMRVSQIEAGAGWGAMHPPHVGHEVIVSFIEGDPDHPIVTGRVYNDVNKPADELPAEHHKSVNRSYGDNDIVIEDKEGDKSIHIKQACGNEIRMHEKTPDIEIKQKCGNEILMREAEGIQIRDKFGNEIVLDAVAGTMKLRSPSHESVIELGKSIYLGTLSNLREKCNGTFNQIIHGTKEEYVAGPVKIKWDGANISFHGGVTSDTFVGVKNTNQLAATVDTFAGVKISRVAARRYEKTSGKNHWESAINDIEGKTEVKLHCGGSSISIKPGSITIKSPTIILEGDTTQIRSGSVAIPKANLFVKNGNVDIQGKLDVRDEVNSKNIKG